jgi:hypothetical protein
MMVVMMMEIVIMIMIEMTIAITTIVQRKCNHIYQNHSVLIVSNQHFNNHTLTAKQTNMILVFSCELNIKQATNKVKIIHTSLAGRFPSSILAKRSPKVHPLITSRGSITLPRLLDILRPYLSRTIACKYTVNRAYKV